MKNYPDWRFNFSDDWHIIKMKDIISRVSREVEKPNKPYYKLSVRSHAKGTFHQYISDPKSVDMENLYVVHKNDLIVNITFAWEHAIAVANESDEGLLVSHRFPTYIIDKADVNFVKYRVSLKDFNYKLDIISPGGAGRNRVMNQADFNEIKIKIPCIEEQKKISDYLTHFDKALTSQEKKVTNWREVKKGMLQKIFSREFRFKDDNGNDYPDWQEKIFEEEFIFLTSNTLSRNDLNYCGGEIKNIHYGDILTKFNDVLDVSSKEIPFINFEVSLKNKIYLQDGDVIFSDTAEDYTSGKVIEIQNVKNSLLVSGLHTISCRPNKQYSKGFLGYYLNSNHYRKQILPLISGIKVMSISKSNLQKTFLKIPCLEEQKKIADYFTHLDKIISAENKILESMREMKKGLLQKLFV